MKPYYKIKDLKCQCGKILATFNPESGFYKLTSSRGYQGKMAFNLPTNFACKCNPNHVLRFTPEQFIEGRSIVCHECKKELAKFITANEEQDKLVSVNMQRVTDLEVSNGLVGCREPECRTLYRLAELNALGSKANLNQLEFKMPE